MIMPLENYGIIHHIEMIMKFVCIQMEKNFLMHCLKVLSKAKKSINIEFYIFKNDDIGTKILNILEEKAKNGVEVRLLYDSVGSRLLNKNVLKN